MTTMMMDRSAMGMPGMGAPMMGTHGMTSPAGPAPGGYMMVPRCAVKCEKVQGGMKITCASDDKVSASMMQNLCTMLAGGMCSSYLMMNGMMACCCNLMMGLCHCEMSEHGVVFTCTSGDPKCAEMIQACCDCMSTMMKGGCTCCVTMNNTPVCCGSSDVPAGSPAKASKR
jgi:hypothetical protein